MPRINMLSSAELIKGQGVSSAFYEQVHLVSEGLKDKYEVLINAKRPCDILHFHTINPEFMLKAATEKKRSTTVGYVHFLPETIDESLYIPRIGKKAFYKYIIEFYKSMDYLVTVNPYFIQELVKYGIPRRKVTYIPNYVSEERFYNYSKETIQQIKQSLEIPIDKFIIIGVGQVQTRKGIIDFVETAKKMPEAYFIWVGGFSFGPITDGYKQLKLLMQNPPENVNFMGIVDRENMNDIYNIADALFLPSYSELFPMTILEGMCLDKPIVLRDLDIYHDILFDYYMRGNNVEEFVELLESLKSNPQIYQKWSEKSAEGHKFYGKDHVLKMWENFYDEIYHRNCQRILEQSFLSKKEKEHIKKETKRLKKLNEQNKKLIEKKKKQELQRQKKEMLEAANELAPDSTLVKRFLMSGDKILKTIVKKV